MHVKSWVSRRHGTLKSILFLLFWSSSVPWRRSSSDCCWKEGHRCQSYWKGVLLNVNDFPASLHISCVTAHENIWAALSSFGRVACATFSVLIMDVRLLDCLSDYLLRTPGRRRKVQCWEFNEIQNFEKNLLSTDKLESLTSWTTVGAMEAVPSDTVITEILTCADFRKGNVVTKLVIRCLDCVNQVGLINICD